jgi:hypothetical protein
LQEIQTPWCISSAEFGGVLNGADDYELIVVVTTTGLELMLSNSSSALQRGDFETPEK